MAATACVIGVIAALGGLAASFAFDTPTGPSIVSVAALLFIVSSGVAPLLKR
jgi:zinc transport system permease protein